MKNIKLLPSVVPICELLGELSKYVKSKGVTLRCDHNVMVNS
jgi:hypothetical protein